MEILNQVVTRKGAWKCKKTWIKGAHPNLGQVIAGLTGWETVIAEDVIVPSKVVMIEKADR
jgi:hypothetical protein